MSRSLFLFWIFYAPLILLAQEMRTVTGKVTDATTRQPLPFAQISLTGTTLGTVTNDDGLFRLGMPLTLPSFSRDSGNVECLDTLMISFLGYRTERVAVLRNDPGNLEIPLAPLSFDLREVEIVALTPQEVLHRAFDSIPVNYGAGPVILTAFIRTQKKVNGSLAEYTEAIVENLKDGYYRYKPGETDTKYRGSNIPCLYKGRVSSDTNLVNRLGEVGASARCLGCNFVHDIAEFPYGTILDEKERKDYTMKMEELVHPGGGKIYRIRFDQDDRTNRLLYQGEMLVDGRDFAILQITYKPSFRAFEAYEKSKNTRTYYLDHQPGWTQEMPLGETTITYAKRNGQWSLSTIRNEYWITYIHPRHSRRFRYGYKNDVVVTDITRDPEAVKSFQGDKSIGVNQRWDEVVGETDETFWESFNFLPIEEKLQKELEGLK